MIFKSILIVLFILLYGCSSEEEIVTQETVPAKEQLSREPAAAHTEDAQNSPPRILSSKLLPASPGKGDRIKLEISAEDTEGDSIFYNYEWRLNDNVLPGAMESELDIELNKGDIVFVKVTPYDSYGEGGSVINLKGVVNSFPDINDRLSDIMIRGDKCEARVIASDPDGDSLTYTLVKAPEGMSIDSEKGILTWNYKTEKEKTRHELKVSVKDTEGAETAIDLSISSCYSVPEG